MEIIIVGGNFGVPKESSIIRKISDISKISKVINGGIEKDEEERRGAVKPTGGVAEPSGYPEYRQRQQQDVTGDDVVEPEAAQERHALQGIVFRYLFREIIVCGDKKRDTESEEEQQCYEMYT